MLTPEQKFNCKSNFCKHPIGKVLNGMAAPFIFASGGLLEDHCAAQKLAEDLKKDPAGAEGAAAAIKADEKLRQIPVVVLTASTSQEDIVRSELLQVESYMTKPVDLKKFLKVVKELERFWHADMIVPT